MTAQYYKAQKKEPGKRLFYATILVVVIFLLDILSGGHLRSGVRVIGATVWGVGTTGWSGFLDTGLFSTRRKLQIENDALKAQLLVYQNRDSAYLAMRDENSRLQELSHVAEKSPGKTVPILSSFQSSPYGTFLIGAGIEEGIVRGSVVVTADGFALGKVSEVSNHTALVTELFAPNANLDAIIGSTPVILEGRGGNNARTKVSRDVKIEVGDIVHAPSVAAPVGVVGKVEADPSSGSTAVFVNLPTNIETLTLVYVTGE